MVRYMINWCGKFRRTAGAVILIASAFCMTGSFAEPYFAVQTGYQCKACHISPSGGGMRTPFGAIYGQTALSRKMIGPLWNGEITEKLSLGGDFRANALMRDVPNQSSNTVFETEEMLVYGHFTLISDKLSFYVDQRVGPGGSTNREAYALYWFGDKRSYVRVGRIFLPFGWRLEDDTAFIRQVPGINYNTPDDGIEIGRESELWSINFALSNGTAGGGDSNSGKQWSLRASHIRPNWRLGGSLNFNDVPNGGRRMANMFAGVKTGKVAWLFEADYIDDDGIVPGSRQQWLGFAEANIALSKGYNLKLSYEYFDPDNALEEDSANRSSIVLEGFPFQYVQLSLGARFAEGIPQNLQLNTDEYFLQLHAYF